MLGNFDRLYSDKLLEANKKRCWTGYERTPGTTKGAPGSCRKITDDRELGIHARPAADEEPVWQSPGGFWTDAKECLGAHSNIPHDLQHLFTVDEPFPGKFDVVIKPDVDLDQYPDTEESDLGYTSKQIGEYIVGLSDGFSLNTIRVAYQNDN